MTRKVLSADQVDQFITCGYTKVEQAFPAHQALAAQDFLWGKLDTHGIKRDDESTWPKSLFIMKEGYDDPVFLACRTDRFLNAIEDLLGAGRWNREQGELWGWWPVNFSIGADVPWDVPAHGWHWDGIHFKHAVDAPNQGLLPLCMFSETRPGGGGTLVVEGSHHVVARFLNQHPQGIEIGEAIGQVNATHPWMHDLTDAKQPAQTLAPGEVPPRVRRLMHQATVDAGGTALRVVETTANPGDLYLCHPFLYHCSSPNHSGRPRFMCNRITPLKQRMNLNRPDGDYSPVEMSIRHAIKSARSTNAVL
jgi:hypothetical protein